MDIKASISMSSIFYCRIGVQLVLGVQPMYYGIMLPRTCTELALREW